VRYTRNASKQEMAQPPSAISNGRSIGRLGSGAGWRAGLALSRLLAPA
jgi:hypothetical protein